MDIFLSRLILNPRLIAVQHDLANCYAQHQRIMMAFPDRGGVPTARADEGVLYRQEQHDAQVSLLVQSLRQPDWSRLPEGYVLTPAETRPINHLYAALHDGLVCRFRLAANPTKRVSAQAEKEDVRWHGKRVNLFDEAAQQQWLRRKGEMGGFVLLTISSSQEVLDLHQTRSTRVLGHRPYTPGDKPMTLHLVQFEGRLCITNTERFHQTLVAGIGPGKAFGMGLLSLASS